MDDTNYYENMIAELRAERDALADEVRDLDIELTHARDERNRLRQHLHDEHQRHIGTMDERDALAALLNEAQGFIPTDTGWDYTTDAGGYLYDRIDAALAKEK